MTRSGLALLAAVAGLAGVAQAQDEEPDLSFLEYLGSWQEGDEDWLVVAEMGDEVEEEKEASAKDEQTDEQEDE